MLYAQVDGGFAVWDPQRNYGRANVSEHRAFLFKPEEVWEGNALCEGLVRDWASWQREDGEAFATLKKVLEGLSPSASHRLVPGTLRKIAVDDPKHYPTLRMRYDQDVAVVHASAGMRRIIAVAYLLVWAWQEHLANATLRGDRPTDEIILLFDEVEAHLHPQWQRTIVPALLHVVDALTGTHDCKVQLIAATHSPLVLASMEPHFEQASDAWFDIALEERAVLLRKRDFIRQGEVGNWLVDAFDLKEPRSLEGERAVEYAKQLMQQQLPGQEDVESADRQLRDAGLPDIDTFWVRWSYFRDRVLTAPFAVPDERLPKTDQK